MDQICSASSAPTGLIVQVCFPGARAAVLDNLNRQREEGRLCDLAIQVQGHVFRAHRCVLAASSPYFHDQVLLKNVTMVSLPSVMDPVAFESVLSSAYTGQLSIVHEDIVNYVTVASFLQMWHIVDKCTELLKRHRPPVEVNPVGELASTQPGTSSRQQSPSSSDCLYVEREARRKDRKPDALPPLATWRRPQQFPKWGRAKPAAAPHSADSQLGGSMPGCGESEFPGCEEVWLSSGAKESHDGHSGPHPEAARQRARFNQRGAVVAPAMERADKSRAGLEMGDAQEKRRDEKGGMEADEGIGEEVAEKRERSSQPGHTGAAHTQADGGGGGGPAEARGGAADAKERDSGETSPMVRAGGLGSHHGAVDPPSPSLVPSPRTQWQASPWSQAELRPQDSAGYRKEEDEVAAAVDFEHLSDGHFVGKTYDEIEDGTGQVSQRPLATPGSPDHGEFTAAAAGATWSLSNPGQGGGGRHSSPSSAPFPPCPSSSPPTPSSSSSSLTLAGAPYTGKVHFCHCGKAYTLKSMRDRHVKMQHLNLRPFGCPVCAKSFKMKHHLTKHLKTHGGLRPYECGLCGKKVIWRESFLRHQARCERLAAGGGGGGVGGALLAAEDPENSYSYGFDHGEALLALAGQVKVEEVDCVSGIMDELRTQSGNLRGQVFKEEASEAFS